MSRVFLIRHAEPATGWGEAGADPGLSPLGRTQAEQAAAALAGIGPLEAVSSPMLRCRETAAPFGGLQNRVVQIEPAVSEVVAPAGVADRRVWLRETFPWDEGAQRRLWSDVEPGLLDWRMATVAAIQGLQADTAVFTHFIAINAILSYAMGRNETIVSTPAHASITELAVHGGAISVVKLGAMLQSDNVL